jgi:putative transposase
MSYGIKEDRNMPRMKHTPEEIVAKLRQVDVLVSQGRPVADAVRQVEVTEVTCYRGASSTAA